MTLLTNETACRDAIRALSRLAGPDLPYGFFVNSLTYAALRGLLETAGNVAAGDTQYADIAIRGIKVAVNDNAPFGTVVVHHGGRWTSFDLAGTMGEKAWRECVATGGWRDECDADD